MCDAQYAKNIVAVECSPVDVLLQSSEVFMMRIRLKITNIGTQVTANR